MVKSLMSILWHALHKTNSSPDRWDVPLHLFTWMNASCSYSFTRDLLHPMEGSGTKGGDVTYNILFSPNLTLAPSPASITTVATTTHGSGVVLDIRLKTKCWRTVLVLTHSVQLLARRITNTPPHLDTRLWMVSWG